MLKDSDLIHKGKGIFLMIDAVVMLIFLLLDQLTKHLTIVHLKGQPAIVLIEGVLELQYVENTGVAFSMFRDQKILILLMGFVVLGVLLFFLLKLPAQKKFFLAHILLSALVAGALGNIIDRIRYDFVVDFISFVLIHYPVFNVADCYIVVSAISLAILFLFVYKEEDLGWMSSVLK